MSNLGQDALALLGAIREVWGTSSPLLRALEEAVPNKSRIAAANQVQPLLEMCEEELHLLIEQLHKHLQENPEIARLSVVTFGIYSAQTASEVLLDLAIDTIGMLREGLRRRVLGSWKEDQTTPDEAKQMLAAIDDDDIALSVTEGDSPEVFDDFNRRKGLGLDAWNRFKSQLSTELRVAGAPDLSVYVPAARILKLFPDQFADHIALRRYCEKNDIPMHSLGPRRRLIHGIALMNSLQVDDNDNQETAGLLERYARLKETKDRSAEE